MAGGRDPSRLRGREFQDIGTPADLLHLADLAAADGGSMPALGTQRAGRPPRTHALSAVDNVSRHRRHLTGNRRRADGGTSQMGRILALRDRDLL